MCANAQGYESGTRIISVRDDTSGDGRSWMSHRDFERLLIQGTFSPEEGAFSGTETRRLAVVSSSGKLVLRTSNGGRFAR